MDRNESKPREPNEVLHRSALGFCVVGMLIVVTVAGTHIGQWLLKPTQTEPSNLTFEAAEMRPRRWASSAEAVPLFKFGDRVLFTQGFFRGTSGRVMEWDPEECTYSVATEWRLVEGVSEQDLHRILDEHPLWPDRELPRPEPVPAPEPVKPLSDPGDSSGVRDGRV